MSFRNRLKRAEGSTTGENGSELIHGSALIRDGTCEIPDRVTRIGDDAFRGCASLKSITIPESVTSIGGSAFHGCTSLKRIAIPDSVTEIGNGAFEKCTSLADVVLSGSITVLRNMFDDAHPWKDSPSPIRSGG